MRKHIILLFLLFNAGVSLMSQTMKSIQEAMTNYNYESAIELIDKEKPTIPLLFQKGKALVGLGKNIDALSTFQEIISQDSLNLRAYIEAGECARTLAKFKQATLFYEKAIELSPNNKYAHIQYINLLLTQRRFQDALGESSVLSETDSSATVLHLLAQSMEGLYENIDPALGCYHLIQEKYPNDYLSAAKLGAIYNANESYIDAIQTTEIYRQIDSTNIEVNRQNAVAYCLNKDYPTAIKRYEYLVSQGDSTLRTCYYLGVSYYAVQRYYDAHDLLKIVLKADPQNANVLYYLGRSCIKTSWKDEGIAYLKNAIDNSLPKDSAMIRIYVGLNEGYKMTKKYRDQIEALKERYEKYDWTNHKLLYDIATIYQFVLKDITNTTRYLEAFLKSRPKEESSETGALDDDGNLVISKKQYYEEAERWLADIKKNQKIEDFFQGKINTGKSK